MLIYANLVCGPGKFGSQIQNSSRKLMLVLSLFQFDLGFSDQGKEKQIRLYQKLLFSLRNKSWLTYGHFLLDYKP